MKSGIHLQKGEVPRQAHVDLGGLKDDELGRHGFSGRMANLYRRNDPTAYRAAGDYRLRELDADELRPDDASDARGLHLPLLANDDCRVGISRRTAPMPFHLRSVDGDTLYFVHRGTGTFETEFGPIGFEPGDYVLLPKAVTYRVVPDGADNLLLVLETAGELEVPDFGSLGRNVVFDPTLLTVPEPAVLPSEGRDEWEVVVQHEGMLSSIFYPHHPCDVAGWKGDLFPFKLNIRDWNVIMSDTIHLPPTVHQFLGAPGVLVCHFLPRPAEGRKGAERLPWYHRNADYDEVAFFHGGSFLGVPLPPGRITHNPQGIHHGPPEAAREMARRNHEQIDRVEWQIIAIDTERPLHVLEAFRAAERAK
jgi:homogentisate 1,2-dioxygenase